MSTTTLHQPTWRRLALALLASASLLLGGCAAMRAQNPDSPLAPVRASAIGDDSQSYAPFTGMRENRHAILLLLAITLVLRRAGVDCYGHPPPFWSASLSRTA